MHLRRYCVTVSDNWTPTRFFWTRRQMAHWFWKFGNIAAAFEWDGEKWVRLTTV